MRAGQALTVATGGSLRAGFAVVDATLNVEAGGGVGSSLEASNSIVNISGGDIGDDVSVFDSVVNISGGEIGDDFNAFDSEVNISGGTGARCFIANSGSVVNISGGNLASETFSRFSALAGSIVNISGGTTGSDEDSGFNAFAGSAVNIVGTNFVLDGESLNESLVMGAPFTILERDVTLSGLLADGSPFSFDLDSNTGFLSLIHI